MDLNLEGKRALVTGSTAGIGAAIACRACAGRARASSSTAVRRPSGEAVATLKAESGGE